MPTRLSPKSMRARARKKSHQDTGPWACDKRCVWVDDEMERRVKVSASTAVSSSFPRWCWSDMVCAPSMWLDYGEGESGVWEGKVRVGESRATGVYVCLLYPLSSSLSERR